MLKPRRLPLYFDRCTHKIILIIVGFFLLQPGGAKASSDVEKSYFGGYTKSDYETISQLVLLDDRTFFFSLWEVLLI